MADIRGLWKQALIVNRGGRSREEIGDDVTSGLADLEAYGQMSLPTRTSSSDCRPARR
jgi:N-ethylmaleimide reductase